MQIQFEKRNKAVSEVKDTLQYITRSAKTKQEAYQRMRDVLPSEIEMGTGGSHIWISNVKKERVAIVYC